MCFSRELVLGFVWLGGQAREKNEWRGMDYSKVWTTHVNSDKTILFVGQFCPEILKYFIIVGHANPQLTQLLYNQQKKALVYIMLR